MPRSLAARIVTVLLVASPVVAQPAPGTPGPPPARATSGMFGNAVRSPEVSPDGRATFRVRAPGAKEVSVMRDGAAPLPMTVGEGGVWSATTDPLSPDIYPYTFVLDGVRIFDPANPLTKSALPAGGQSLLHVPGPGTLPWEVNDVARGIVHHHFYRSGIVGDDRDYYVYTPPGYDPAAATTYPVLFLLHGITDDASAWTTAGRANVILDNLIAAGKARPMIMVNTFGYGVARARTSFEGMADPASMTNFAESVLKEVLPRVEADYRVTKHRDARAVVGLSMGGAQACFIGLNHPGTFAWVAAFSGAYVMYGPSLAPGAPRPASPGTAGYEQRFPNVGAGVNDQLRLLWLGMGTEDRLLDGHRQFAAWLSSKGMKPTTVETTGAHTWMVWRRYLADVAPMLFQDRPR